MRKHENARILINVFAWDKKIPDNNRSSLSFHEHLFLQNKRIAINRSIQRLNLNKHKASEFHVNRINLNTIELALNGQSRFK